MLAIGGIRAAEGARLLRGLSAQCEVIGAEFGKYNPLIDGAKTTTGIVMDRLIRATLAGVALRKSGNSDPNYLAPEALDHGVE